jgi:hypothetical protein
LSKHAPRTRYLRHPNADEKATGAVLVLVSSIVNGRHRRLLYEHKLPPTARAHLAHPGRATEQDCESIFNESQPQQIDRYALARRRQRAWSRSRPLSFDDLGSRAGSVI